MRLIRFYQACFFFSISNIFYSFKIRIHNSCICTFPKGRTCKKKIHTLGGVDWHLPNRKVTYLRSAFLLFDAAIFFLEALKQKILDCPENIFSPVKLPTLYPGYVLNGEVHHNMRRLKEEEQSVLVSVTLMKGITGFKKFRKNPE